MILLNKRITTISLKRRAKHLDTKDLIGGIKNKN
jgi:hypothetical protein